MQLAQDETMNVSPRHAYEDVIDEMCALPWSELSRHDLNLVAGAYQHFSTQFCETVEIACARFPADRKLIELRDGECDTDNLSPYPGVAEPGERMNHDEFMRRTVAMADLTPADRSKLEALGDAYLATARAVDPAIRILSLPSYEDGGLERLFRAVLRAESWDEPSLAAFQHFLVGHVSLDSNPETGHGALCRHLRPDDRILPLWRAFQTLLVDAVPRFAQAG